jgi:uncharacterized membrane protein
MWGIAMVPFVVTSLILQGLPDKLPMHYDLQGNIDRWGSKTEELIFPIIILLLTGFWHVMIAYYEKKAKMIPEDKAASVNKAQAVAKSNSKLLTIVGICMAVMFGVMHFAILYASCVQANAGLSTMTLDIGKLTCTLAGIFFIIIGNFLPKTKVNSTVGVRTPWSMYNENTWRLSNRLGAWLLIIAGLLTILTTVVANGNISTIMLLVYLIAASVVLIIYSKIVYDRERREESKKDELK